MIHGRSSIVAVNLDIILVEERLSRLSSDSSEMIAASTFFIILHPWPRRGGFTATAKNAKQ
jgi:hypothetical protein